MCIQRTGSKKKRVASEILVRYKGWEVKVWGPQWTWEPIEVTSPRLSDSVWVDSDYIYVKGESHGCFGPGAEVVVVPLPIVQAMIEARAIINQRHTKTTGGGEQ